MVAHREFLEAVARRAGLDRPDAAKQPAEGILVGVARRLDQPGRDAMAATLPTEFATLVRETGPEAEDRGTAPFLSTVASELTTSEARARFLTQAVLSALVELAPPRR